MKGCLLFVCLVLQSNTSAVQSAGTFPTVKNPPKWGWDTLGSMVFAHTGEPQAYDAADLKLLSKFSMVQFDKKQNEATMPGVDQEDRFIAAARSVKSVGNGTQVLMYLNGLINFPPFQRLYNATVDDPSLLLKNSQGKVLTLAGHQAFDMRLPKMRQTFVDAALYGMSSGAFNGLFIDRANWAEKCQNTKSWDKATCDSLIPAQRQLFVELTAALGEGNITLAKETSDATAIDWQVANAAMTSDSFCSHYCHGCNNSVDPNTTWSSPVDAQNCANSIATIANMSARGQLTQSHAMGPFTGELSATAREFTIAAFLIGAGPLSFFSFANWAIDCWELTGTKWWPEYDYKLGEPTTPPNTLIPGHRWKYSRNFSSGTTVYIDVATRVVEINWAK